MMGKTTVGAISCKLGILILVLFVLVSICSKDLQLSDNKIHSVHTDVYQNITSLKYDRHIKSLDPDSVRNQVIYYWCGAGRRFQFQNYVSMMSVIQILQPDNIYFLYDEYPEQDKKSYYTWLEELTQNYPFVRPEKIHRCPGTVAKRVDAIMDELSQRGGFYVHENTTIMSSVAQLRSQDMINALDLDTGQGFLMAHVGADLHAADRGIQCVRNNSQLDNSDTYCVNTEGEIFPMDIWEYNGTFGPQARWAVYGETAPMIAKPDYSELAPNIAHYTWPHWEGRGKMDYTFYLSVLSALYVAEVDAVYIHGEAPTGPYWERLQPNHRIKVVYRNTNTTVYGQPVEVMAHISDVWRLDTLIKYGGLYMDIDSIIVKPIDIHMRAYSAYIALDWLASNRNKYFPKVIQNGVMLGKRGGTFWKEYQKTTRVFADNQWIWNSCELPYKVVERYPKSVRLDPYFQISCNNGRCRPESWMDNTHASHSHPKNISHLPAWTVANTYHFTGNVPRELTEENAWKETSNIFSEMTEYILQKADWL